MKLGSVRLFERREIAGDPPLLVRYILFGCAAFGVYLHHLLRSDYDRALHDHPWPFVSIILTKGYTEIHDQTIDGIEGWEVHPPRAVLVRPAEWRHRLELTNGPCWSLVIVGRRKRRWGFWMPDGWCWWRRHNPYKNICEDDVVWHGGSD